MNTNANTTVLTAEEINEHRMARDNGQPAIYVSTYEKYNNGSLNGMWVDLSTFDCAEDLYDFCKELHGDEDDPELMIQDFQNFPKKFYCESYDNSLMNDLFNWLELDDKEKDIVAEYWEEVYEKESIEYILDSMVSEGDFSTYAYSRAQDFLSCHNAIGTFLERYFNYDAFEKDLMFDYDITTNYIFSNH